MNHINEAELNETERLGLAWCRLNNRVWDPLLGEQPKDFNKKPEAYTFSALKAIEAIIGEASCSWFWWRFFLGKSRAEWLSWWLTKDFPKTTGKENAAHPTRVPKKMLRRLWRR